MFPRHVVCVESWNIISTSMLYTLKKYTRMNQIFVLTPKTWAIFSTFRRLFLHRTFFLNWAVTILTLRLYNFNQKNSKTWWVVSEILHCELTDGETDWRTDKKGQIQRKLPLVRVSNCIFKILLCLKTANNRCFPVTKTLRKTV